MSETPAQPPRPRLDDATLDSWESYALRDEAEGKHFLAPPGALLALIAEVRDGRLAGIPYWSPGAPLHVRLSYWLRPYDAHLDARRWRWQEPGCSRSRRAAAGLFGKGSS